MQKIIGACVVVAALSGCATKIENTYTVNGDHNAIKASDTVHDTPSTTDLIDAAGTRTGSATANGGK